METLTPEYIANIAAGLGLAALTLYGFFRKKPPKSGNLEVAGALIDGTQARNVVDALDRNSAALDRNTEANRKHVEALEDNSRETRRLADEIIRSSHR
ncbi:hypothetical protein Q4543_17545 [Salipiger sp. 1_MG-2023]|uniref:hypothetical protein n=1 Tax=Salipiger sp. 1_MG-2023 TaxID=3062665 RepID=UPI0026E322EE|nr:hypothetical protein [Salipiger sp. 1_MG-2023]MDO6587319.1 hypothetical protein [Salipiger sp. 1_MG-2023]